MSCTKVQSNGFYYWLAHRLWPKQNCGRTWKWFTRKMYATYQAVVGQAIRTMDRIMWLLHEALVLLEPREFDGHDGDGNAMMPSPLQPIIVYSLVQRLCHTTFVVATANIAKWKVPALQLGLCVQFDDDVAAVVVIADDAADDDDVEYQILMLAMDRVYSAKN